MVALPGILVARSGLQVEMQAVIDRSGMPFATMFMDKSVLDEQQPAFVGMYDGAIMTEEIRASSSSALRPTRASMTEAKQRSTRGAASRG